MTCIHYQGGYRYQLTAPVSIETFPVQRHIVTPWIALDPVGVLTIRAGYAWDGPSGPAFHTRTLMRGTLVHDALYQLLREGHLDRGHRRAADRVLRALCLEDGMWATRAAWIYGFVRLFGGLALATAPKKPVQQAPQDCPPMG